MTIESMFGLGPVRALPKKYYSKKPDPISHRLVGLEVEVENIPHPPTPSWGWALKADGSLRNHGVEYVSHPMPAHEIRNALGYIFDILPKTRSFSQRTSIHCHVNVRDLELDQAKHVVLLYCLFENLLFTYVGKDRHSNIFCAPVNESHVIHPMYGFGNFAEYVGNWSKYTALNICPISTFGTFEFRQMHGTDDIDKLVNWCNILTRLVDHGSTLSFKQIKSLLLTEASEVAVYRMVRDFFGPASEHLDFSNLLEDVSNGLCQVRQMVHSIEHKSIFRKELDSPFSLWKPKEDIKVGVPQPKKSQGAEDPIERALRRDRMQNAFDQANDRQAHVPPPDINHVPWDRAEEHIQAVDLRIQQARAAMNHDIAQRAAVRPAPAPRHPEAQRAAQQNLGIDAVVQDNNPGPAFHVRYINPREARIDYMPAVAENPQNPNIDEER